jgi:hypothetical protein
MAFEIRLTNRAVARFERCRLSPDVVFVAAGGIKVHPRNANLRVNYGSLMDT